MIDIIFLLGRIVRLKFRDSWPYDVYCSAAVVVFIVAIAGIYL